MKRKLAAAFLAFCLILGGPSGVILAEQAGDPGDPQDSGTQLQDSGTVTVTGFEELAADVRWQRQQVPNLPATLAATGVDEDGKAVTPVQDSGEAAQLQVPVTWQAEGYNPAARVPGMYVFTAKVKAGYVLAQDVVAPIIAVMIPDGSRIGGYGTATRPLQITEPAQLKEISTATNEGRLSSWILGIDGQPVYSKLMNDLDLSAYSEGKGWVPIGDSYEKRFVGSLDGDGHKITGLRISRDQLFTGLFGHIGDAANQANVVKNLHLVEVDITGTKDGAGGVAGWMYGTMENCSVSGSVNGKGAVGGLAGEMDGTMKSCRSTANIQGSGTTIGGLVGGLTGTMESCSATGNVTSTGDRAGAIGGLVGAIAGQDTTVKSCSATGSVTATGANSNSIGGVVGMVEGTVENCYATGAVAATGADGRGIGGVVGVAVGTVKNCAALGPDVQGARGVFRVIGNGNAATRIGNRAFDGMTKNGSSIPIGESTTDPTNAHGKNLAAASLVTDGTVGGLFTGAPWTTKAGMLPGFGAPVAMPMHLMSAGANPFDGGDGTSATPYKISTPAQLKALATLVNDPTTNPTWAGKAYELTADLSLSAYSDGTGWVPIGDSTNSFKGTFKGGGKKISGLKISTTADYVGLFGFIDGGTVEHLGLVNVDIEGDVYIGGVAGDVKNGTVKNCFVSGKANGGGSIGGVVGHMSGSGAVVDGCYTIATVGESTSANVGGIVGYLEGSTVTNCAALSEKVLGNSDVNRVVGATGSGNTLSNNRAFDKMIGGTAADDGITSDGKKIAAGDIIADPTIGGLFTAAEGWATAPGMLPGFGTPQEMPQYLLDAADPPFAGDGTKDNPYQISSATQLARLALLVYYDNINNPTWANKAYKLTADIDLSAYRSGNGWVPIGVSGNDFKGTFDGSGKKISGLFITGSGANVGLFGMVGDATIQNVNLVGVNITSSGDDAGGVVGWSSRNSTVANCSVTGSITSGGITGGVVGASGHNSTVENCYSTATVTGTTGDTGGVVGKVYSSSTVRNCYSTGSVTGAARTTGGVVGLVENGSTVENCAALNRSVKATGGEIGRVVGLIDGGATVANNHAYAGMSGSFGAGAGAADKNGADVTINQALTASFWQTTMQWSDATWSIANDRLPTLKNGGSQNGDSDIFLSRRTLSQVTPTVTGSYTATGSPIVPTVTVVFDGKTLVQDVDYTMAVTNNVSAGTATVTVTGINDYVDQAIPATFAILPGGGRPSSTPVDSEARFWRSVQQSINAANKGDVLKIDASPYANMPDYVMVALNQTGVGLVIAWQGGKIITIPAGQAQGPDGGQIYWPISLLAQLYQGIELVEEGASGRVNPETGGYSYRNTATSVTTPVTGTVSALVPLAELDPLATPGVDAGADALAVTSPVAPVATDPAAVVVLVVTLAALAAALIWQRRRR